MQSRDSVYFDGESAAQHVVMPRVDFGRFEVEFRGESLPGGLIRWPLAELRALQDHADRDTLTVTLASLEGGDMGELPRLVVRDPDVAQSIRDRCPDLNRRAKLTQTQKGHVVRNIVLAISAVVLMVFVILPGIARVLAEIIPVEREVAFGKTVRGQIEWLFSKTGNELPVCSTPEGDAAMAKMTALLTEGQDIRYDLDVSVVDHELINAFALPGGQIVFFRGLIDSAEGPDEVAAVLAHELGHVVNRDPMREALRSAGSVGLISLIFGDFTGGAVLAAIAETLVSASYSQRAEETADDYAHEVLERANISPDALGSFFKRLRDEMGDVDGFLAHLSTHPKLADRIESAAEATDDGRDYDGALSQSDWKALQTICEKPDAEPSIENNKK